MTLFCLPAQARTHARDGCSCTRSARPADGVPPTPTPPDLTSFPCNRTEHWEGWNPTQGPRTLHCPARLCTLNAPFIPRLHVPLSPTFPVDGMFVPPDSCAKALTRTVMVLGVGPLERNRAPLDPEAGLGKEERPGENVPRRRPSASPGENPPQESNPLARPQKQTSVV